MTWQVKTGTLVEAFEARGQSFPEYSSKIKTQNLDSLQQKTSLHVDTSMLSCPAKLDNTVA